MAEQDEIRDWDLSSKEPAPLESSPVGVSITPFNPDKNREETRGDLARGLLWLLTFTVGGLLVFVGVGRLEGSVLTQSVFPSLIALAGTALGFYFGSQSTRTTDTPDAGSKKG